MNSYGESALRDVPGLRTGCAVAVGKRTGASFVSALLANMILVYISGNAKFAQYLQVLYLPGTGELTVVCGAMLGAALGFLWFNSYPADVFMGDVGSLSLGGSLGTIELDQIDKTWYPYVSVLTEGQISVPFRVTTAASYGFQIILMRKRIPAHVMTLEADYHKIEALALNYKRSKDYQNWMNELRSRIYWQIKDTSQ